MKRIKIIALTLGLIILSGLVFVGVANAQSFKSGDNISVPASETIDGMLFAAGGNIDIAGTVDGDMYCAGQTVNISGTINGDVFCAGQTINVSGKIDGNLRLAGQTVTLSGLVGRSASIASQDLSITKSSTISRDLLGGSQNVTIHGSIGRDFTLGTSTLTLYGKVGRDIKGGVETLTVGSSGIVGRNVDYYSTKDPVINNGGKISGKVTRTEPKRQTMSAWAPVAFLIGFFIYALITMLIIGLVISALFPRILEESAEVAMKRPGQVVLVGFLAMILVPALITLLMLTVVGIPLAIMLILTWVIIAFLSTPFAGYLVGRVLLRGSTQRAIPTMLLGITILTISYFIPILGFITFITAYLFGVGMILSRSRMMMVRTATVKSKS